ncbi:ribonuclease Z [Candidatus Bathyarchaeota archaeon]|nr:ribonuclease Z [Candidatus Bathyarchaeota archaeon]
MKITFLGTSGSMPTPSRGSSSIAVKLGSEVILFDCGEGTQRQMVSAHISFMKIYKILISHLHGDHILGLPGLLQTMSLLHREDSLDIYGPKGTHNFLQSIFDSLGGPGFKVTIHELIEKGVIYQSKSYHIEAIPAIHRIEAWSYGLFEEPRPGRFYPEKARALHIPEGVLWKNLQENQNIEINGRIINWSEVVDPPRRGRRLIYSGDTSYNDNLINLAQFADVLIHEATFTEDLINRATDDGHTTAKQAAELALKANVKLLILTHISSRYSNPEQILQEAQTIFPNVKVAHDLLELEIPFTD